MSECLNGVMVELCHTCKKEPAIASGRSGADITGIYSGNSKSHAQQFTYAGESRSAKTNHARIDRKPAVKLWQRLPREVIPYRKVLIGGNHQTSFTSLPA